MLKLVNFKFSKTFQVPVNRPPSPGTGTRPGTGPVLLGRVPAVEKRCMIYNIIFRLHNLALELSKNVLAPLIIREFSFALLLIREGKIAFKYSLIII